MEKQAEQAEVSLEGLWLPSLPSPSSNNAHPSAYSRRRWADPSSSFTTALSSRACDIIPPGPDTGNNRTRPATVATQVISRNKSIAGAASDVAARSGAATAGACAPKRTRYVDNNSSRISETDRVVSPRVFHEAEAQSDNERDEYEAPEDTPGPRGVCGTFERNCADGGGRETPLGDPVAARLTTGREGDGDRSDARAPMSQHTAAMLERSRMLVAKAKVGWRGITGTRMREVVSGSPFFCRRSMVQHVVLPHPLTYFMSHFFPLLLLRPLSSIGRGPCCISFRYHFSHSSQAGLLSGSASGSTNYYGEPVPNKARIAPSEEPVFYAFIRGRYTSSIL